MIKPTMPNIPGMGAMNDTLEFVKNLWGGMHVPGTGMPNIPGMVMPTLSVDDINKQIADLRAVESWLNVNMNMLRATIQALEVQSATITTLQAMGESFSSAVKSNADATADAVRAATATAAGTVDDGSARRAKRRHAAAAAEDEATAPPQDGAAGGKADAKAAAKPDAKAGSAAAGGNDFTAPLANPALWWNMLQDQFKQAVGNAMAGEPNQPAADGGGTKTGAAGKNGKNGKRKSNSKSL